MGEKSGAGLNFVYLQVAACCGCWWDFECKHRVHNGQHFFVLFLFFTKGCHCVGTSRGAAQGRCVEAWARGEVQFVCVKKGISALANGLYVLNGNVEPKLVPKPVIQRRPSVACLSFRRQPHLVITTATAAAAALLSAAGSVLSAAGTVAATVAGWSTCAAFFCECGLLHSPAISGRGGGSRLVALDAACWWCFWFGWGRRVALHSG